MTVFEGKKLQGRPKVLNKAAKIGLKKAEIQKRKLDKVALTTVSKPSLEQVHEKRRLEAPERPKKTLLSPTNNDHLL